MFECSVASLKERLGSLPQHLNRESQRFTVPVQFSVYSRLCVPQNANRNSLQYSVYSIYSLLRGRDGDFLNTLTLEGVVALNRLGRTKLLENIFSLDQLAEGSILAIKGFEIS